MRRSLETISFARTSRIASSVRCLAGPSGTGPPSRRTSNGPRTWNSIAALPLPTLSPGSALSKRFEHRRRPPRRPRFSEISAPRGRLRSLTNPREERTNEDLDSSRRRRSRSWSARRSSPLHRPRRRTAARPGPILPPQRPSARTATRSHSAATAIARSRSIPVVGAPLLRRNGSIAEPFLAQVGPPAAPPAADGFDWGDAAIGAVGAYVLILLASGAVVLIRRRRPPQRLAQRPA